MADKYGSTSLPLSGILDVRSMPENMGTNGVRYRENFSIATGRMSRRTGFQKLLSNPNYNNQDYHDQMLGAQFFYGDMTPPASSASEVFSYPSTDCLTQLQVRDNPREHVTLIFEVQSASGYRRLIIGTQSRLLELNEHSGTWRILADGLGGPTRDDLSIRFRAAQLKDVIVFTNNYDAPLSYKIGDRVQGCDLRATRVMTDLENIRLTRAAEVVTFGDRIFLLNIVLDGGRLENAYIWSDLNDATSFDPARISSVAELQSIPFGNNIIRAKILLNNLLIYASRGIFAIGAGFSSAETQTWTALYETEDGTGMIAYPNTLVSTGDAHRYFGIDGIYKIDRFSYRPEREDWLHRASGIIFAEINKEACDAHVGGTWSSGDESGKDMEREIHWSWAKSGNPVPYRTIGAQPDREFADYIDHGFTSFGNYRSSPNISAQDFFANYCVCTESELADNSIKEGVPTPSVSCPSPPTVLLNNSVNPDFILLEWPEGDFDLDGSDVPAEYNGNPVNKDLIIEGRNAGTLLIGFEEIGTIDYAEDEDEAFIPFETENYDGEAIEGSLCAVLAGATLGTLCPNECPPRSLFVAASSSDLSLKQIGTSYSREMCLNAGVAFGAIIGTYSYRAALGIYDFFGYNSVLRLGPLALGEKFKEKDVRAIIAELETEVELNFNVIAVRVGYSYSALDANREDCGVTWSDYVRRHLACPQDMTPAEYRARNIRPTAGIDFPFFQTGRFIYVEMLIAGLKSPLDINSAFVPCIGGNSSYSSLIIESRKGCGAP